MWLLTIYLPTLLNFVWMCTQEHTHTHIIISLRVVQRARTHTHTLAQNHTWNLVASCSTTSGPIKYIHSIHYHYYYHNTKTNNIFWEEPKYEWMLGTGDDNLRLCFRITEIYWQLNTDTNAVMRGFQNFVYYTWMVLFYLHI